MRSLLIATFVFASILHAADSEKLSRDAIDLLRQAQSDPAALIPAVNALSVAIESCEKSHDDAKAAELNSYLYWAHKRMTLADLEKLSGNETATRRLEVVKRLELPTNAADYLERANAFAKSHSDDPLLIAIRYFEVGDRFRDTDAGRTAIDLSLKFMQKIASSAKLMPYTPASTDGKVFVQSDPLGATIILMLNGVRADTGKKTPALVQLPKGHQNLSLELPKMKPAELGVDVSDSITKLAPVKLELIKVPVDVVFEEGWLVFVDNKPCINDEAKQFTTPCTVGVPLGAHLISIAKDGFWDITQRVDVKSNSAVDFKQRPSRGPSNLLKLSVAAAGATGPGDVLGKPVNILPLIDASKDSLGGTWSAEKDGLTSSGSVAKLALPYTLPEEYDFKIAFTRLEGNSHIVMLVPHGNMMQLYLVAANDSSCELGGWGAVKFTPPAAPIGKRMTAELKVRKGGVEAWYNDKLIKKASGYKDCGGTWWNSDDKTKAIIGSQSSTILFHEVSITPVGNLQTR